MSTEYTDDMRRVDALRHSVAKRDAELARLRAALAERDGWIALAAGLLRNLQWVDPSGEADVAGYQECAYCPARWYTDQEQPQPCAPDCALAEALATVPQP